MSITKTPICKCGEADPRAFGPDKRRKSGLQTMCKVCHRSHYYILKERRKKLDLQHGGGMKGRIDLIAALNLQCLGDPSAVANRLRKMGML